MSRSLKIVLSLLLSGLIAAPIFLGHWARQHASGALEEGYNTFIHYLLDKNSSHNVERDLKAFVDSSMVVDKVHPGWFSSQIDAHVALRSGRVIPVAFKLNHGPAWLDYYANGNIRLRYGIFELVMEKLPDIFRVAFNEHLNFKFFADFGFHKNMRAAINVHLDESNAASPQNNPMQFDMTLVAKGSVNESNQTSIDYISLDIPKYSRDGVTMNHFTASGQLHFLNTIEDSIYKLDHLNIAKFSVKSPYGLQLAIDDIALTIDINESENALELAAKVDFGDLQYNDIALGKHSLSVQYPSLPFDFIQALPKKDFSQLLFGHNSNVSALGQFNDFMHLLTESVADKHMKLQYANDSEHTTTRLNVDYTFPSFHYRKFNGGEDKLLKRWCFLKNPDDYIAASPEILDQQSCVKQFVFVDALVLPMGDFQEKIWSLFAKQLSENSDLNVSIAYQNQCKNDLAASSRAACGWFENLLTYFQLTPDMFLSAGKGMRTLDISWHNGKKFINGEIISSPPE